MGAKTIEELIELLEKIEDKSQVVHVWDRYGYYGTNLTLEIAEDQLEKPLVIKRD